MNPFQEVNWQPDCSARRKFALSLMVGFPTVAVILLVAARIGTHSWKPIPLWLGLLGAACGGLLWLVPQIARPFYLAWYFVACCLGFVVGNLLLTVFFYLCITPVGVVLRIFGRAPIRDGIDRKLATYWKPAEKGGEARRYYRPF